MVEDQRGCARGAPSPGTPADGTFLAPPGRVSDWRMVLVYDAAAEAGLLAGLPGTLDEVAHQSGRERHPVRVVLEALGTWGIVALDGEGCYHQGPAWPDQEASAVLRHHAAAIRRWAGGLEEALSSPPQARRPPAGPRRLDVFLGALGANARRSAPAVVTACLAHVPGARRMLDLGGGHGRYALEFSRRGVRATLQDRPEVVEHLRAEGSLARAGVELVGGDFFETLPEGPFDIILCAGVTHTYDAEHNVALYRRLSGVTSRSGRLAILTLLGGRGGVSALFAVQMLVAANGGDTHRSEDYRRWLGEAGFSLVDIVEPGDRPHSLLLAAPEPPA